MGAGNWIPSGSNYLEWYGGYYILYDDIAGEGDYEESLGYCLEDLIGELKYHLKTTVDGMYALSNEWRNRDEQVIAELGYVKVILADNQHSLAVYVIHEEFECEDDIDDSDYYKSVYDNTFKNLTNFLQERYPLYIRTGPWTSRRLKKEEYYAVYFRNEHTNSGLALFDSQKAAERCLHQGFIEDNDNLKFVLFHILPKDIQQGYHENMEVNLEGVDHKVTFTILNPNEVLEDFR